MKPRRAGSIYRRGAVWWIKYYDTRGNPRRESSHSSVKSVAEGLLRKRLGEVARGARYIGADFERTTFDDLERLIVDDWKLNERKSVDTLRHSFAALADKFHGVKAREIGHAELVAYANARRAQGRKNATIRRELGFLRRAFKLAERDGRAQCPSFPTIHVDNARQGFFEAEQWAQIRGYLPPHIAAPCEFQYLTGWRIMEVLTLMWPQVDFGAGIVRLEGVTTKSGRARTFPFAAMPELKALLISRRKATEEAQRTLSRIIPYVFHDAKGKPLFGSNKHPRWPFRRAWHQARTAAGFPDRRPHDFRRTAVRNLERAGVRRSVAMELIGHKTESMYRRYDIASEADLFEGVEQLARHQQTRSRTSAKGGEGNGSEETNARNR